MSISHDHRLASILSAAGFLLATAAAVIAFARPAWLTGLMVDQAGQTGLAVTFFASVLAASLTAAAVVFLLRDRMRGGIPALVTVLAAAILGLGVMGLGALSWSIGFDEADAGAARSTFGSLLVVFIALAWLLLVTSIATAAFSLQPAAAAGRRGQDVLTLIVSAAIAAMVAIGAVSPVAVALASCGVFVLTVLLTARAERGKQQPAVAETASSPGERRIWAGASRLAVLLAWIATAATIVVWGTGLTASILLAGEPGATTALGRASALGQLSAIPLLWCATVIFATRMPASATAIRSAALLASVAIASSTLGLAWAGRPDGVLLFALMPILGLAVGVWAGIVAFGLLDRFGLAERWVGAVVLTLGAAFVYNAIVTMSGGIPLLLFSAVLALWGARAALRPRDAAGPAGFSPATLPVSG